MENKPGENTEEIQEQTEEMLESAQEEATQEVVEETAEAPAEEVAEEGAEEVAEEVVEESAEEPAEVTEEAPAKSIDWKEKLAGVKKGLSAFWKKVNPIVDEPEEEPDQEEPAQEETTEEAPAEEPVQEAPVRRKPADAFIIDFPVEEEPVKEEKPQEEAAEGEMSEEGAQENTEEAVAESTEELTAEETETTPAKKPIKPFLQGLILGGCVVLVGLIAFFALKSAGVDIGPRPNDVYYKDSYTATQEVISKKADTVVATMGDRELTLSELQLYYINSIYAFYSQNYYYMSMMGLDLSQPLDQQYYMGQEGLTWEQFFLDSALNSWQNYTVVEILAERDNFSIDPQLQAQIDSMPEQLESIAAAYGYENAEAYLNEEMAPGVTMDVYVNFNRVYCISNEYVNYFYETQYPNNKDITLYYKENQDVFASNGVSRDMGLISDVRHILVQPKGGVTDENGVTTYSEDEWATALSEAERILKQWNEGEATEESFAVLANTYSEDGGSNTIGGLYEDVHIDSNYVPEFKNWAIDFTRKPGDVEIVQTTYGYHIMYFVSGENYFERLVGEQLVAERIQRNLLAIKEELPMEVNFKKVLLCEGSVV